MRWVETDFTTAATYFGSNLPVGLALLFDGVNEDSVAAPDNLLVGMVEALTNEPIATDIPLSLPVPTDFADAVTNAQGIISSVRACWATSRRCCPADRMAVLFTTTSSVPKHCPVLPL